MKDGFDARFVVDVEIGEVWDAITQPAPKGAEGELLLAGFPSFEGTAGARCSTLELEPERLLRVRKEVDPCKGSEIAIVLERAEGGTQISIVQSRFGDWLDLVRGQFEAHWWQIVADLRLFIERRVHAPGTRWGANFGAQARETPTGLVVSAVDPGGAAERAGVQPDDLLLTFGDIRVHDWQQFWTVLAFANPGDEIPVSWIRDRELLTATAKL